jgi:predicted rRNA methylase YqxC with S4 and FtsJ domains
MASDQCFDHSRRYCNPYSVGTSTGTFMYLALLYALRTYAIDNGRKQANEMFFYKLLVFI